MNINQIIAHEVKVADSFFYRLSPDVWLVKMRDGVMLRVLGSELFYLEKEFKSKLQQDFDDDVYV